MHQVVLLVQRQIAAVFFQWTEAGKVHQQFTRVGREKARDELRDL